MFRPEAIISRKNLTHNFNYVKKHVGNNVSIMPVVKANAYGHGVTEICNILSQYDIKGFCVALLSEVIQISKDMEQLVGNILVFTFAGHDTTAHTLTWLIYELCKNPLYKKQLIEEIDLYWENNESESYDTFNQLPFI